MSVFAKAAGRFSETAIDDEIVVMHLDSGEFYSLGGTARTIWLLIDGERDRAAIIAALTEQYASDEPTIVSDLDPFLDQLLGAGLIEAR